MNDFAKPSENISIYRQTGRCYLETAGIFSCFSTVISIWLRERPTNSF